MQAPVSEQAERKKRLLIYLLIGFALISLFVCVFIIPAVTITGSWLVSRPKQVEAQPQVVVPNVVGQDYRKGEAVLKEHGLRMQVLAKRWDENQPVDVIVLQNPSAGESVAVGHTIDVVIGAKPPY